MKTSSFSIEHLKSVKVPAIKVYDTLTTPAGLAEVWTTELNVNAEIDYANEITFGKETDRMKVIELLPEKKVKWLVIESDQQWIGTVISFELSESENLTTVVLTQEGWREVNDFHRFCNYHWAGS
jgi:hypothetical protein